MTFFFLSNNKISRTKNDNEKSRLFTDVKPVEANCERRFLYVFFSFSVNT